MLGEKYLHFLFGQARGRRTMSCVDVSGVSFSERFG